MTYEKGIPDYAMVPAKEMEERVIVPITKGAIYSPVQVTNITEKPKTTITLEEDILVPDTKPDLREILMIDGKSHLAVKEIDAVVKGDDYINLSGEIELQTLYLPEKQEGNLPVISVQTRVPFKDQWHTSMSAGATMVLDCSIEKIEYMVINERKYRVKVILAIMAREYTDAKVDLFEGLVDEDIQVLKETVEISNVALRKKDTLSIKEDILPKEDSHPESILKQDINVVENYKQISGDKVVINGFVYVNLLYFSSASPVTPLQAAASDDTHAEGDPGKTGSSVLGDSCSIDSIHQLQERVEFTQFIPIQQGERQSGCNICFDDSQLRVKLTQDEDGADVFRLEGELLTYLELYKNMEKEIIVDGYHRQKDFVCDFEEKSSRTLIGTSSGESSVREIISLENTGCDADRIVYTTAEVLSCESHCEQGKIVTEGVILVKMICSCEQEERGVFAVREEIPYRVVTAMPQLTGGEIITQKVYIKDLWAEKINGKQIEFNATIMVCAEIMRPTPFKVLTNPAFEEPGSGCQVPPMVVYICRKTDTLWQIAKRFKTTTASVREVNELETDDLSEGQKLLIIK